MTKPTSPGTLLDELEAIHQSLQQEPDSEESIPTLEEVVGHRAPTSVNRDNPFLSSSSLSELIRIRNEAENNVEAVISANAKEKVAKQQRDARLMATDIEQTPARTPNPEHVMHQMEVLFDRWIDSSVEQYMSLFESELRNRLQQDFRGLVMQWYRDHNLPMPKSFTDPGHKNT